jgi:hypothetical protein
VTFRTDADLGLVEEPEAAGEVLEHRHLRATQGIADDRGEPGEVERITRAS